jgi:signal transduction histidine kinase
MSADRPANILLVDDRLDNLLALEEVLQPLGQNVVRATSGEDALKHLLTTEFAVILLDVQMPGMDGFETATRIKQRERTRDVPIIFLTAISAEAHHQLHGYRVGAVDYLPKPFDPWVLRSKVAVFVELYNKSRVLEDQAAMLREKTVELERATATMRDFLAMASHDLRGPISVISGSAATLQAFSDRLSAEDRRDLMGAIVRKTEQLDVLVGDLLTVSKLDAGAVEADRREVVLEELIGETVCDLDLGAPGVRVTVPGGLVLWADPDHLRRILRNYVENAVRHGALPIEIDARESGGCVEIRVSDSGVGVPEPFVPRLFEKFARGGAQQGEKSGSGLGLSIVRGLAEAGGGQAWYEPREPTGSCFGLRLPKAP